MQSTADNGNPPLATPMHHSQQNPNDNTPTRCFPFLSLPFDIRLTVYDHLPFTTTHTTVLNGFPYSIRDQYPETNLSPFSVTFVTRSLSSSILRTSRQIHTEALPIFRRKFEKLLHESVPPRIIIKCHDEDAGTEDDDELERERDFTLGFIISTLTRIMENGETGRGVDGLGLDNPGVGEAIAVAHAIFPRGPWFDMRTLEMVAMRYATLVRRRGEQSAMRSIDVSLDMRVVSEFKWASAMNWMTRVVQIWARGFTVSFSFRVIRKARDVTEMEAGEKGLAGLEGWNLGLAGLEGWNLGLAGSEGGNLGLAGLEGGYLGDLLGWTLGRQMIDYAHYKRVEYEDWGRVWAVGDSM